MHPASPEGLADIENHHRTSAIVFSQRFSFDFTCFLLSQWGILVVCKSISPVGRGGCGHFCLSTKRSIASPSFPVKDPLKKFCTQPPSVFLQHHKAPETPWERTRPVPPPLLPPGRKALPFSWDPQYTQIDTIFRSPFRPDQKKIPRHPKVTWDPAMSLRGSRKGYRSSRK